MNSTLRDKRDPRARYEESLVACKQSAVPRAKGSPRGATPRSPGRLRAALLNERGDVAPSEADEPSYPYGGKGFLFSELVDHGLEHAQERGHLLHLLEDSFKTPSAGSGTCRFPATGTGGFEWVRVGEPTPVDADFFLLH